MRSATLFSLSFAALIAGVLGAIRPKRSATAEYCNGQYVCNLASPNFEPTSTGFDPATGDLQCSYGDIGISCAYDPSTGDRTEGPSSCPAPTSTLPGYQCRTEDTSGNPNYLEYSFGGYLFCRYGTAQSYETCYYQTSNGGASIYNDATLCPATPIDCTVTATTNPTRRHKSLDNFAAVKSKLEARLANGSHPKYHAPHTVKKRTHHA